MTEPNRTILRAPTGCTCYRTWNPCPACQAWNARQAAREGERFRNRCMGGDGR